MARGATVVFVPRLPRHCGIKITNLMAPRVLITFRKRSQRRFAAVTNIAVC